MRQISEVARPGRPDVAPAEVFARRQRFEERAQRVDRGFVSADHHRVTLFEAPDAAARAYIDELVSLRPQRVDRWAGSGLLLGHGFIVESFRSGHLCLPSIDASGSRDRFDRNHHHPEVPVQPADREAGPVAERRAAEYSGRPYLRHYHDHLAETPHLHEN